MDWDNRSRREALAETCRSLADLAAGLEPAQWSLPTGCPGWDVHDQIAHVSSLESVLAGAPEPEHVAPARDHVRNSVGTAMENLVDRRRGWSPAEVVAELRAAVVARQAMLAELDDDPEAMVPGPTGRPMPIAFNVALRTFDCLAHEQDVRRAVGLPGGLDGAAGRLVAENIPQLLAGAWSEHAGTVALDVQGERTVLHLGERSADEPDVTLSCTLAELVALSTGRSDVGAPTVTGDPDLAARLLADMALTP